MVGIGCILLGRNTARFEIWDGMRAIDYLQSRPEVDPQRIGCTGNSGGGTQTSYLMALDDRIRAAAPSCYHHGLSAAAGDHRAPGRRAEHLRPTGLRAWTMPTYIMMRAPSPVLSVRRHQGLLRHQRHVGHVPLCQAALHAHGICRARRHPGKRRRTQLQHPAARRRGALDVALALGQESAPIVEPPIALLTEKEFQCTPDGQVMRLPGARSVYDLNEEYENQLAKKRARPGEAAIGRTCSRRSGGWPASASSASCPSRRWDLWEPLTRAGLPLEKLSDQA